VTPIDRYPASVFWRDEDEGYIATAPDLPGCSAFGPTPEQALSELRDAIAAWIEAANNAGNPVPEPSQPGLQPQASGKVLLRMPRTLHAELVQGAKRDHVSLNQYIVYLITSAHSAKTQTLSASAVVSRLHDLLDDQTAAAQSVYEAFLGERQVYTGKADRFVRLLEGAFSGIAIKEWTGPRTIEAGRASTSENVIAMVGGSPQWQNPRSIRSR
jgi:predicted RNase H-like HicB family nuclease